MVIGMGTLLAEVSNMHRAVGFYRDLLGLTPGYVSEDWADFMVGPVRLGLHPPFVDGHQPEAVRGGWILGIEVEDLAALRRALEESEVRILSDDHAIPGGIVFTFADPDGNRIQAMQRVS